MVPRIFLTTLKKFSIPFLIIILISTIISLLIAEKIIRFASPQLTYNQAKNISLRVTDKSDFLPSDLKPNQQTVHIGNTHEFSYPVRINSLGYRMEEFSQEKPNDEYRILMLGDSMTFGYGVEEQDNIPSVLRIKLNEYLKQNNIGSKKIQIINAGFADGKAPDTYYLYLKKVGLNLNPDLIIVNYFINNDIADLDDNIWEKVGQDGLPEKINSKTTEIEEDYTKLKKQYQNWKITLPILRNSHLWILFATTLETKSPNTVARIKNLLGSYDSLPLVTSLENENCLFLNDCSPIMQELSEKYFRVLNATIEVAKSNDIHLVVSLLPANPQVKQVAQVLSEKSSRSETILDQSEPQKRIKKFLEDKNVDVVDPLVYVTDANWSKYYFEKDGHPTREGYAKLSQAFFDYLIENWQIDQKVSK